MLTPAEQTGGIVQAVRQELKIDQPGNGIIFVQDVSETYGIVIDPDPPSAAGRQGVYHWSVEKQKM